MSRSDPECGEALPAPAPAPGPAAREQRSTSLGNERPPRPPASTTLRQQSDRVTRFERSLVSSEMDSLQGEITRRERRERQVFDETARSDREETSRSRRRSRGITFMPPFATLFRPASSSSPDSSPRSTSQKDPIETFICAICYERHPFVGPNGGYKAKACEELRNSTFCYDCTGMHLNVSIREGKVTDIHCMCGCGAFLSHEEVAALIANDDDLLQRYERFRKLKGDSNYRECPHCGTGSSAGSLQSPRIVCSNPDCSLKVFCFVHGGQHPADQDCAAFASQLLLSSMEKASLEAIGRIAKACPGCSVQTEKNAGCNHMTCRECKCNWCWLCGADISGPDGVHAHFAAGSGSTCSGLQFTERGREAPYPLILGGPPPPARPPLTLLQRSRRGVCLCVESGLLALLYSVAGLIYVIFMTGLFAGCCLYLIAALPVQLALVLALPLLVRRRGEAERERLAAAAEAEAEEEAEADEEAEAEAEAADGQAHSAPGMPAWFIDRSCYDSCFDRWWRNSELSPSCYPTNWRGARITNPQAAKSLCDDVYAYLRDVLLLSLLFAERPTILLDECMDDFWD